MSSMGLSGIKWPLVITAGVLSEVAVVVLLSVIILTYRFVISPGKDAPAYESFGHRAGYRIAPPAAGLSTMAVAVWAGGRLSEAFVLNGFVIGVIGVMCAVGFFLNAKPEERFMYLVSFVLRLAGGIGGGFIAASLAATRH